MSTLADAQPSNVKRTVRQQWDAAAAGWNEQGPQIRDWLCRATDAMLEMAGIRPGHHVLDVAAGAGDQTLDIAARVGPTGRVLATDISPDILAHASQNAAQAGLKNVETLVADAEILAWRRRSSTPPYAGSASCFCPTRREASGRSHGS